MYPRNLPILLLLWLAATFAVAQTWTTEVVPDTLPDYGFYHGAAFDANGTLYIAYSAVTSTTKKNAPSVVRYITRTTNGVWSSPVTIDSLGASAISVAIDSNGNPAVTESQNALHYLYQDPNTHAWNTETVESSAANDVTSLAFDPSGLATIAYRTCASKGGTKFARRTAANTWSKQIINPACNARYISLAYDANGNPGIAYSDVCSGSGAFNCLKYAHYNSGSWTTTIVEQGTTGYGTFASLAYDANNNPAITHFDYGVRYLTSSNGVFGLTQWVNGPSGYGQGAELRFDAQNNPSFAFQDYNSVFYTGQLSNWTNTTLETGRPSWIVTNRAFNGVPFVLFYTAPRRS